MSARSSGTTNRMGVASSLKSSAGISRAAHWNGMVAHTVARRPECGAGGVEHGHLMARMKVIYKITWPNGKIYVGKDRIEADFMRLAATPLPIPAPAPDDAVPTVSPDAVAGWATAGSRK